MASDNGKSLPGMSIPKWMTRGGAARYDYGDYCASPPMHGDGFFHMEVRRQDANHMNMIDPSNGSSNCVTVKKMTVDTGDGSSSVSKIVLEQTQKDLNQGKYSSNILDPVYEPDSSSIYKTVSSSSLVKNFDPVSGTQSVPASPKTHRANFYADNYEDSFSSSTATTRKFQERQLVSRNSDIGRPPSIVVTHSEQDSTKFAEMVESTLSNANLAIKSAPVSPNATPVATPLSSPQVARKSGNPYFTGSSSGSGSGSFLFRSPNQESGSNNKDSGRSFYETKVDVQVNPVTKTVSKSVRYVPKPNELRELNFWSPTSM